MTEEGLSRRRLLMLAPLAGVIAAGAGFYAMLMRMEAGTFDPHGVPNPLVGHRIPDFDLPAQPLPGGSAGQGFSSADIIGAGRPVLVNFFASWCVPCLVEADELGQLSREGIPLWGIAYKDKPEAVSGFLERHGNPYARIARDEPGRAAIDWGVTGVPETYLIDKQGVVRWRWTGPLTPEIVAAELRPFLKQLA